MLWTTISLEYNNEKNQSLNLWIEPRLREYGPDNKHEQIDDDIWT